MFGSDLVLNDQEQEANKILMEAKHREIDAALTGLSKFLPSENFIQVVEKIEKSYVFKVIQKMPKGAILHVHSKAMPTVDYILRTVTHHPHLYVCEENDNIQLQFFSTPDEHCKWKILSDVRQVDENIDDRIKRQLTTRNDNLKSANLTKNTIWDKFESIFTFLTPLLNYRPVYEDVLYQGLLDNYNDNILYLELRTSLSPLYDINGTTYNQTEVARISKNVVERFQDKYSDFVGAKLIIAPWRGCSDKKFEDHLRAAEELKRELPDFIAGFDLVGQEDKGKPLVEFAEGLRSIGNDVQLFFHSGKTNWYGTSVDENLVDAVLLNTKRIGHGFALLKHPKVMEMVRDKSIAIEVSPISNQVLGLVKDLRNHPAAALFANNYPVVVSNDDPLMWGAKGLSYDFYEAFVGIMSRSADLRALKKLALNSIEYSSMNVVQKKKAKEIWDRRWENFIDDLRSFNEQPISQKSMALN
ncbi:adenosine deaminase 2-like [Copidosoma floridanum]|uniref:adenosine deaminase 2-like n=1 Tax=Copidosoma floridanum TaxID=29053 RepID=UPI0006C9E3A1|nr:adenosine deaminase 2-like [Copidosoma floridanum]